MKSSALVVGTGGAAFHHIYALKKLNFNIDVIGSYEENLRLFKELFDANHISSDVQLQNKYKIILINKPLDEHFNSFIKYRDYAEIIVIEKPISENIGFLKKIHKLHRYVYEVNQQIYNPFFYNLPNRGIKNIIINISKSRKVQKYSSKDLLSLHLPHALDICKFFTTDDLILTSTKKNFKSTEKYFSVNLQTDSLNCFLNFNYSESNTNFNELVLDGASHKLYNSKYFFYLFEKYVFGINFPAQPIKEFYHMYKAILRKPQHNYNFYYNKANLFESILASIS